MVGCLDIPLGYSISITLVLLIITKAMPISWVTLLALGPFMLLRASKKLNFKPHISFQLPHPTPKISCVDITDPNQLFNTSPYPSDTQPRARQRAGMKLLTLNFLTCAIKSCKSSPSSFPLHPRDAELEILESDLNLPFLKNILSRLMWDELRTITSEVRSFHRLSARPTPLPAL